MRYCVACDQDVVVGHRCPRAHTCKDCGRPAETFIPGRMPLAITLDEMLRQILAAPDEDIAICSRCFAERYRREQQRRAN